MALHYHFDHPARNLALGLLALACTACAAPGRQLERLDRGVVAIHTQDGNFVSWRALASDDPTTAFDLHRDGVRVNDRPLVATNLLDSGAAPGATYRVTTAGTAPGAGASCSRSQTAHRP